MIDTKQPAPTSFSNSSSLSSTTHQQSRLTKKQKKASAFRDKSSRRKTKNIGPEHEQEVEMEDLHVFTMEKPSRSRYASGSVQMGNEEGQTTEGTERSKSTRASGKGLADSIRLVQQEVCGQSRQQKSHPKRQRIDAVGAERSDGEHEEQDEKRIKKRKRANLDAADEKLGMGGKLDGENAQEKGRNKRQKIEKAEHEMDCAEGEGEGEEMSEDEGGEERKQRREKQRFILFIGWSLSVQILWYSRGS